MRELKEPSPSKTKKMSKANNYRMPFNIKTPKLI